jgi:hypothetical protein
MNIIRFIPQSQSSQTDLNTLTATRRISFQTCFPRLAEKLQHLTTPFITSRPAKQNKKRIKQESLSCSSTHKKLVSELDSFPCKIFSTGGNPRKEKAENGRPNPPAQ